MSIEILQPRLSLWPTASSPGGCRGSDDGDDDARTSRTVQIQCVGPSYVSYRRSLWERVQNGGPHRPQHHDDPSDAAAATATATPEKGTKKNKKNKMKASASTLDLLSLSEEELLESGAYTHYDVLNVALTANPDALKRSYHKACLKYHPDKTGRGEEDYVFLAIKHAYDTLSDVDKRRAYDSTMDFDESIPTGVENVEGTSKFYDLYGPVFERNLRFAVRKRNSSRGGGKNKRNLNKKGSNVSSASGGGGGGGGDYSASEIYGGDDNNNDDEFPSLGDDDTPLPQVQQFYEFWTHFESWRDFTLKATKLTEHDVDAADSRDEKRWMSKEIDRKARSMKREEMARINLLVERAMAVDPRLRRAREEEKLAKERSAKERKEKQEREAQMKREKEEEERVAREKREEEERKKRAELKVEKEREKKQVRKSRQTLRKMALAAYDKAKSKGNETKFYASLQEMNDELEYCCEHLSLEQMEELIVALGGGGGNVDAASAKPGGLNQLKHHATQTRTEKQKHDETMAAQRETKRREAAKKEASAKAASAMRPFTKEELTYLTKSVKKYPAGGANRWETIANFLNNALQLEEPRSKEECIAQYNKITSNAGAAATEQQGSSSSAAAAGGGGASCPTGDSSAGGGWTVDQDKKLQEGLAKYPSNMDKNERWTSIAKCVPGKSKKECVQRFKVIRDALKNKGS